MIRWLTLLLWLAAATAHAEPLQVGEALDGQRIDGRVTYLRDESGALGIEQVRTRAFRGHTERLDFGSLQKGSLWLRLPVSNPRPTAVRWMLELGHAHLDQIVLYLPDGERREQGDLLPFAERELAHHTFVFELEEPPRSQRVLYLRVASRGILYAPLRAWSAHKFLAHEYLDWTLLFAFYGVVLVMAAYNACLYLFTRLPGYALFAFVALAEGFQQFTGFGHTYQFLLPNQPALEQLMYQFSCNLGLFANCLFLRHQLERQHLPRWTSRLIDWASVYTGATTLLVFLLPYRVGIASMTFTFSTLIPLGVGIAIYLRISNRAERYVSTARWADGLLFGWLAVLVGALISTLATLGYLPRSVFSDWSFQIGATLQLILISSALSGRLRWLESELSARNGELMTKITDLGVAIDLARSEAEREEAAGRAKSAVVATMTHELRTPLNAIINIPQGMLDEFADGNYRGAAERTARGLEIVERAGLHLLQVVEGILDPAGDKDSLRISELDVVPLLGEVSEQMASLASLASVKLRVDLGAPALWVAADPLRMRQILINLIGNAIKFSRGRGTVTVSVTREPTRALFAIADEGIGIAKEQQARIFESFQQSYDRGSHRFGGTGLGLSIVKSLVRSHGGEVWVDSEMGRGATFFVAIPLAPQQATG